MPELGKVDRKAGEIWVENSFELTAKGENLSAFERNRLYLNYQGDSFVDASFASQADLDSDSRSVVGADFDRDGAPDLLVASVGGGPLRLFRNQFPRTNSRVRFELVGVESNRQAIGSRVIVHCGDRLIVRDLFPTNSCLAGHPVDMLIGLGDAKRIDRVSIRWPTGKTQEFSELPVNSQITITEGDPEFKTGKLVLSPRQRNDACSGN